MKIDVKHTAKLANLPLKEEEVKKFEKQLSEILGYIEELNKVKLENVQATSQVTGLEDVTREDTASPSLPADEVVSQAKKKHNGFFEVPAILDE